MSISVYDSREKWRASIGMSESECRCLVAIISAWHVYGKPVLAVDVQRFLTELGELRSISSQVAQIKRRGWIVAVGKVNCAVAYQPSDRAYRLLGLEKRPSRAA